MHNLPSDFVTHYGWEVEELRAVVEKRCEFASVKWTDVFSFGKEEFEDFIRSRVRNGPRDMLRLLELGFVVARQELLSIAHLQSVDRKYKSFAYRQMTSVYESIFPGLGEFLRAIFEDADALTEQEFAKRYDELSLESFPNAELYRSFGFKNSREALSSVIDAGCIDIKSSGTIKFPYEEIYYDDETVENIDDVKLNHCLMK